MGPRSAPARARLRSTHSGMTEAMSDPPEALDITDELIAERRSRRPGRSPRRHAPAGWRSHHHLPSTTFSHWTGQHRVLDARCRCSWHDGLRDRRPHTCSSRRPCGPTTSAACSSGALFMLGAGYALIQGRAHPRRLPLPQLVGARARRSVDAALYLALLYFPGLDGLLPPDLTIDYADALLDALVNADHGHRVDGPTWSPRCKHRHASRRYARLLIDPGGLRDAPEEPLRDAVEPVALCHEPRSSSGWR